MSVVMDIEKLNSYLTQPQALFSLVSTFYDQNRQKPAHLIGKSNTWIDIINKTENYKEAEKCYEASMRWQDDEVEPDYDALSARVSALLLFISNIVVDRSKPIKDDDLEKVVRAYGCQRDFIFAAAFTPLRLYTNGKDQPFFDPIEFMANLDLVRKTMGPILASLSWEIPC